MSPIPAPPPRRSHGGGPRAGSGAARGYLISALLLLALAGVVTGLYRAYSFGPEYLGAATYAYPQAQATEEEARTGAAAAVSCLGGTGRVADHQAQSEGPIRFTVTTPANYRADRVHPLLIVWAPAGFSAALSERFTGLTRAATASGFVIAHVGSLRLDARALRALARVPAAIAATWCIDRRRVFYSGHSDGGTVSNALAVLPERALQPAAIAPSAMGMREQDMAGFSCPPATAVMVMHNRDDRHFPDYGAGVARWWARCNGCRGATVASAFAGCSEFPGCRPGGRTLLCQGSGGHAHWPGFDHDVIGFLAAAAR